ncbi:MAG: S1C family serine protease [Lachnospiraceae bacterium]|nr:S1C family serine protease [Lachnospiraceae bacterium]MDE7331418.1 S1C family serine protease [Lachnospiraceae bacterium]
MEEKRNQDNTDFMKETIKQRPLNRRKLVRRTLITAAMAVVFGMVACVTFLLLEPLISNRIYPEEEPQKIVFEEETKEEEILPEDMIADDSQMQPEPTTAPVVEDELIARILSEMDLELEVELGIEDYAALISSMGGVAKEVKESVVTVVGVTSDIGWLDNEYESEGAVSGLVVADNGKELLILANVNSLKGADSLTAIFADGEEYPAAIKKKDNNTGLAVISILKSGMKGATLERAKAVRLGTSGSSLVGTPVIALGRPMGTEDSLCYGNITSANNAIKLPDSNYKYMTTDIYGSGNASGILINLGGQVVGIIDMANNPSDMKNLVSAIGISEIKKLIEELSNDRNIAYLGVYGADVTQEANTELGVPFGAYLMEIDMDSPAMDAGIQSGDVIIRIKDTEINNYQDLVHALLLEQPENTVRIGLMRQGPEGYTEMDVNVLLGLKRE